MVLVLLLLGLGVGAALFGFLLSNKTGLDAQRRTDAALAEAKAAFIGYALRSGADAGLARPGEFPCPDTKSVNDPNYGFADATCAPGQLGRVPWKTLGIAEPKDAWGQTLWYALAGPFRNFASSGAPINSDTRGNITVSDGVNVLTGEAAAVLFAPAEALGGQSRDRGVVQLCATTGTNLTQDRCPANYLDVAAGVNNAIINGPFINARPGAGFNDRVVTIATPEFMPAVEMRVAAELRPRLESYKSNSTCACYPWADSFMAFDGTSDDGVNRGRFPLVASPEDWGTGTIPLLPQWFGANNWHNVIYYSVARTSSYHPTPICKTCVDDTLTVSGNPNVGAVFFTPGTPGAAMRPSAVLSAYLDDAQNNDGGNDIYVVPAAQALDRDRITILPGGAPGAQCSQQGAILLANTPCGQPPRLSQVCVNARNALQVCACATAATQLITPPCENTLKPPACQSALAIVAAC